MLQSKPRLFVTRSHFIIDLRTVQDKKNYGGVELLTTCEQPRNALELWLANELANHNFTSLDFSEQFGYSPQNLCNFIRENALEPWTQQQWQSAFQRAIHRMEGRRAHPQPSLWPKDQTSHYPANFFYQVVCAELQGEEESPYLSYGLTCYHWREGHWLEAGTIHDISTIPRGVMGLAEQFNRCQLHPDHMRDVVVDRLAELYF